MLQTWNTPPPPPPPRPGHTHSRLQIYSVFFPVTAQVGFSGREDSCPSPRMPTWCPKCNMTGDKCCEKPGGPWLCSCWNKRLPRAASSITSFHFRRRARVSGTWAERHRGELGTGLANSKKKASLGLDSGSRARSPPFWLWDRGRQFGPWGPALYEMRLKIAHSLDRVKERAWTMVPALGTQWLTAGTLSFWLLQTGSWLSAGKPAIRPLALGNQLC